MGNKYRHLSLAEREEISCGIVGGKSFRALAKQLGRNVSTISREVTERNPNKFFYRAVNAQKVYDRKNEIRSKLRPKKLDQYPPLKKYVFKKLRKRWSPEQIAKTLKTEYPNDETMQVSSETILYLLPKGSLRKELLSYLRQKRAYRRGRRKKTQENRGKIPEMISIEERPKEVEDRIIPGHWEGDLIIGKRQQSAIGTLVERTTRFTIIVPLVARDAVSVRRALAREAKQLPKQVRRTLTYDQGSEMTEHRLFAKDTKMKVYFCNPGSPWERGANENTNGLIRDFFPKGTDFNQVTSREIKRAQKLLNERPRKILNWKTPGQAFNNILLGVAL